MTKNSASDNPTRHASALAIRVVLACPFWLSFTIEIPAKINAPKMPTNAIPIRMFIGLIIDASLVATHKPFRMFLRVAAK